MVSLIAVKPVPMVIQVVQVAVTAVVDAAKIQFITKALRSNLGSRKENVSTPLLL
jgi:hypothetical protein